MIDPAFDHDRLDVYRPAIKYTADAFTISQDLKGLHRSRFGIRVRGDSGRTCCVKRHGTSSEHSIEGEAETYRFDVDEDGDEV